MNWYKISSPIDTDWIEDIHEVKKNIPDDREVIVYHGTSSKKLAGILSHGSLDPSVSGGAEFKSFEGASPGIFVTTQLGGFTGAELYAYHSSSDEERGDGSDKVILELQIPLSWIEGDPDDTRMFTNEEGVEEMNQLGKQQGVVSQPIPISRIKGATIYNDALVEAIGGIERSTFSSGNTEWMPIGKLISLMSDNAESLSGEYKDIASVGGLSRNDYKKDREQVFADRVIDFLHTFVNPADVNYDKVLSWSFNNYQNAYAIGSAESMLRDVMSNIGLEEEYIESIMTESIGGDWTFNAGESLYKYLRRQS
jgi:hypothetical protein